MYTPAAFAEDDRGAIVAFLRRVAFGHLVTAPVDKDDSEAAHLLQATALPFVIDDDLTRVRAHFARANGHWRSIDGSNGLLIVPGHDSYISPRWYPSKAEAGRVVPTWNYELVHLHGTIKIHDDAPWTRSVVEDLTDQHEQLLSDSDPEPGWKVADAPDDFIEGQLKAIVGLEVVITNVEAKRKLSQNRAEADRLGAAAGLARSDESSDRAIATAMTADER